jgi:hypothetical protein
VSAQLGSGTLSCRYQVNAKKARDPDSRFLAGGSNIIHDAVQGGW